MRAGLLLLLAASLCAAAPAYAEPDVAAWRLAIRSGEAAYRRGDHVEASRQFGIALKIGEEFGEGDARLATNLSWVAESFRIQGRLTEAEAHMKRALEIREKVLGPTNMSTQLSRLHLSLIQQAIAAPPPAKPPTAPSPPSPSALQAGIAPLKEAPPAVGVAIARPQEPARPVEKADVAPKPPAEVPKPIAPVQPVPAAAPKPEPKPAAPPPVQAVAPKPEPIADRRPVDAPPAQTTPAKPASDLALKPAPALESKPLVLPPPVEIAAPKPEPVPAPKPAPKPAAAVPQDPAPSAQAKPEPAAALPVFELFRRAIDSLTPKPAADPPAAPQASPTPSRTADPKPAAPVASVEVPPRPAVPQVDAPKPAAVPREAPVVSDVPKPSPPAPAPKPAIAAASPSPARAATPAPAAPKPSPPVPTLAMIAPKPAPPAPPPVPLTPQQQQHASIAHQISQLGSGAASASRAFELMQLARLPVGDEPDRRVAGQAVAAERTGDHLRPAPVALAALQAQLGADEALASYLVFEQGLYLLAVRRDRAGLFALDSGRTQLADSVRRLRTRLDPANDTGVRGQPSPFPVDIAHQLYRAILAPADALIRDAAHLIVVPDDSLQGLPFAALVTDPLAAPVRDATDAPKIAWLGKRHALTVMPSEGSLHLLRRYGRPAGGSRPFAGFGDPLLRGDTGRTQPPLLSGLIDRNAAVDLVALRNLARLPDTRYVLNAMADILNAAPGDVHVEADAAEETVKRVDLSAYDVLAFATYGLMGGEFPGRAEPALVFTPPRFRSEIDDGLLTASEVAQLKLNADLVVLSASSTAAPDGTPGVDGLPRLARAFLQAGSRSILVSHWNVSADSTLKIVSRMLRERARGAGNAESLRRAMLALMNGEDRPAYTHPMYWAHFALVGEGGRSAVAAPGGATRR